MIKSTPPVESMVAGSRVEGWTVGVVLLVLAIGWTALGSAYYQRVMPFYDSMAYQERFILTVDRANEVGAWTALQEVWKQSSNVALFNLFAAGFGRILPESKEGLYLYLFGIHFAGIAALVWTAYRSSGARWIGVYAAAAWLACRPFKEAMYGVLDQRMDLASGSFCLIVAALFFDWARKPSYRVAALAGVAVALAILHRPVMGVTIAGISAIFVLRAWIRHGIPGRAWWKDVGLMVLPGIVLTLPWLIYHSEGLKFYYLIFNVDVGSASSMAEAAKFNLQSFWWAMDGIYALLVVLALVGGLLLRRIDWLDFSAVLLSGALPLALLITSRSMGNILVAQVALATPALALASLRWSPVKHPRMQVLPAACAGILLFCIGARSLHHLADHVAGIPRTARMEAMQVLREFDLQAGPLPRIVTGFQSIPLDCRGLAVLAREEGIKFQAGTSFFHPTEFGFSNDAAKTITAEELRGHLVQILRGLRGKSSFLLIVTADTEKSLPPVHFSQLRVRDIREAVEADKELVRRYTTSPIQGIKFDVYAIPFAE